MMTHAKIHQFYNQILPKESRNLKNDTYSPFRKPNDTPMYINRLSNHPPTVTKALPKMISTRLSTISSTEAEFKAEAPLYQKALNDAGYEEELVFQKPEKRNKRSRQRKTLWFNPPYSINVSTNITVVFRNLLNKHFPKGTFMNKLFNNNNTKVSYSCMTNVEKTMSSHNKKVLSKEVDKRQLNNCSCKLKEDETCPLQGNCMDKGVVYEASVTTNDNITKTYIGAAATTFKDRLYNHRSSFIHQEKRHQTALSSYMWSKTEEGMNPTITWRTITRAQPYSSARGRCDLCLQEKVNIIMADPSTSLNRRSELTSKCRHKFKHTLAGWDPGKHHPHPL